MNREEAKVPNVEGDWKSIEIFLFSNGQQYSPPRKYLLRVDELNLWDATLNHLAHSHYGLQSPLINLYTTNGQLVRGPLDLRDGQAYVAVVPPDSFVDAGYQKYLMKASKSWEKRQAKKFPPDAVSQELMLPESEHMDLEQPSGHFVSSAPGKLVAVDGNEPKSGKIACSTCGHVIRPGEIEYSAVRGPVKSNEYAAKHAENVVSPCEARPGENAARLYEYTPKLSEVAAGPVEYDPKPRDYETRRTLNGAKTSEYKTRASLSQAKPAEYGVNPDENVAKPAEYRGTKQDGYITRPSVNGTRPGDYGARHSEYEKRTSVTGARPNEYETRPSVTGARPNEYETRPSDTGARPIKNKTRPSEGAEPCEYKAVPNEYETKPGEHEDKPNIIEARPNKYETSPRDYETRTSVDGAKPGEYRARPAECAIRPSAKGGKPSENGARPLEYNTRPSTNGAKPDEYGARLLEYNTKPSANGARPGEYETRTSTNGAKTGEFGVRPLEYDTIPSVNRAKLGEFGAKPGEYETGTGLNSAQPAGYETRPSLNGAKPVEYETRPSLNGAKPVEYNIRPSLNGAKPGEYETSPSLNVAKPAEYETRSSLNQAKPGKYETSTSSYASRPAEYDSKSNANGAELGEYRAKPNLIGARPADYATQSNPKENKPDETTEPNPVKKEASSGENGDRTASLKGRPGHNGPRLSKIEPIKKAYEIALHKNEKSLDESEDRPDKDTVEKDVSIKCQDSSEFPKQASTLGPIGKNELEKKGEHSTKKEHQRDKEIEAKDRSSGNGKRVGEKNIRKNDTVNELVESRVSKIDNARKIEQGGRTGELTRGLDHGSRGSVQKGRDTNLAEKAGGQGARENGTRLSGQINKQSDNLARLGGRESRVGDHEARAGDLGFGTTHDAGSENPVSREAEPVVKAAVSDSRGSPKDKMSSRPKTNLGLPKIRTPGTRVDERSVRLNDSDIQNKEGNPETGLSRLGETEATEALRISEARQHHARKSSLSAGRPSFEKKRLSIGQNSTLQKKPVPNSTITRKTEDNTQPVKTDKEKIPKKINEKSSAIPVPASKDAGKSKTQRIAPLAYPPKSISTTINQVLSEENAIDETEVTVELTHSFKDPESEATSMRFDSVKHVIDTIEKSSVDTQTELIYNDERNMAYASINEGVQTDTETVEQHGKEVSASDMAKTNSCTCILCRRTHVVDPDENTISMLNKGGVVNIKLNIQVRNIVKSVCSCEKVGGRSHSLTNIMRLEKESQITFDNNMVVNRTSLQSLFNKQNFGGFGFEGSPKVMVVQCAGCGRLNNPPRCDPPPCCDNNKKYFVLLANSVLEDMEDGCRPCDQRQSRKQCNGIPVTQALSETTLDTVTTVTVSGVPLQRREMGKCVTNTSCQTEEPLSESGTAKRKVSITEDSVTKCDLQKKSNSSVGVTTQPDNLVMKPSYRKMCLQKCEREDSQACSELCRVACTPTCESVRSPSYEKVEAVCSQVPPQKSKLVEAVCSEVSPPTCKIVEVVCSPQLPSTSEKVCPVTCEIVRSVPLPTCEKVKSLSSQVSSQACPQVQSKGCQQASPQVQSQGCMPSSPTYPPCCFVLPPPNTQVQTQVCSCQGPQVCNAETQTRWASILLQARLHCDGRYSFHLPPLYLLKNNNSCCQ